MKSVRFSLSATCLLFGAIGETLPVRAANQSAPPQTTIATTLASDARDAETQFNEARAHLRGEGVVQDYTKAFILMQQAAAQGHAEAEGGLGYLYSEGLGIAKDEAQAVQWFQKAADRGSAKAQFNLGRMLIAGRGTPVDQPAGIALVQKAAEQDMSEAQYVYGEALYLGRFGLKRDREQAFVWAVKAAEAGLASAQNLAGLLKRDGSKRNLAEAESWFRKAALQGDLKAQSNLGHLLFRQPRADRDRKLEGLKWLLVAERLGEPFAARTLETASTHLPPDDLAEARQQASTFQVPPRQSL